MTHRHCEHSCASFSTRHIVTGRHIASAADQHTHTLRVVLASLTWKVNGMVSSFAIKIGNLVVLKKFFKKEIDLTSNLLSMFPLLNTTPFLFKIILLCILHIPLSDQGRNKTFLNCNVLFCSERTFSPATLFGSDNKATKTSYVTLIANA